MTTDARSYDAFLSYNRQDKALAQEVDAWLRSHSLRPFLDQNGLRPGFRWFPELQQAIDASGAMIVLVGAHGLGNTQQYEIDYALERQTHDHSFPVIPLLLPGCLRRPTGFSKVVTWVDLSDASSLHDDPRKLQSLLAAIRPEAVTSASDRSTICPYMGLEPFRQESAAFFCGREKTVEELIAQVHAHNFVAVVGRSGSGKSSLVFAGLIPALLRQHATDPWDVVTFRPGNWPLHELAAAFNPAPTSEGAFITQDWLEKEVSVLRDGPTDQLASLVGRRLATAAEKPDRLLLYVDQWEELYSMEVEQDGQSEQKSQHAADVERFIALLIAVAEDPRARVTVVLTVRADFYRHLMRHPRLSTMLPRQQVNMRPLLREDLRAAIVTPAQKVGLAFAPPGLVDQILDDVGTDEGMLPLLQFALRETWLRSVDGRLTADAYFASGRVQGAIQATAERTYQALTLVEKVAARRLFLGLVRPGEGQEDTRTRIALPEDNSLRVVANKFANPKARLIIMGSEPLPIPQHSILSPYTGLNGDEPGERATVEVAHEALIRTWSTLRSWLDANRDELRTRTVILQQEREWTRNGRLDSLLLPPGFQLERAKNLLAQPGDVPVADLVEFITLSDEREERRQQEARARLVEEQRLRADEQEASNRRLQKWLTGAFSAAAIAVIALVFAGWQWIGWRASATEAENNLERALSAARKSIEIVRTDGQPWGGASNIWTNRPTGKISSEVSAQILQTVSLMLEELYIDQARETIQLEMMPALDALSEMLLPTGDRDGSLRIARDAHSLATLLSKKYPEDPRFIEYKANALHQIAGIMRVKGQPADLKEALISAQAEVREAERLAAIDVQKPEWQWRLAFANESLGDVHRWLWEFDKAGQQYKTYELITDKTLPIVKSEIALNNWTQRSAIVIGKMGDMFLMNREFPKALSAYSKNLQTMLKLIETDPGNTGFKTSVAVAYERLGIAEGRLGQNVKSIENFDRALNLIAEIPGQNNESLQRIIAISHLFKGEAFRGMAESITDNIERRALRGRAVEMYKIAQRIMCAPGKKTTPNWQRDCTVTYTVLFQIAETEVEKERLLRECADYDHLPAILDTRVPIPPECGRNFLPGGPRDERRL